MDYGNLKVPENVTPEVQTILDSYEARNKEIENAHRKNTGRIWLGSALSGASAHPVFNIPYIGTGLGGALYELGQGITEGDKLPELAKRTGAGFAIGETVGAIPYAGKYANKLSGGKIGNALTAGVEKIASTSLGQKVAEIAPKVEDLLMTDIKAFNPFKQTVYHGSPADFNKFSNEFIGTGEGAQAHGYGHYAAKNKDVAEGYADKLSNGGGSNIYDENKNIYNADEMDANLKYKITEMEEDEIAKQMALASWYTTEGNKYGGIQDAMSFIESDPYFLPDNILNKAKNILQNNWDNYSIKTSQDKQLYKLSIPKDDVMLREGATFAEQPKKVQNGLENYFKDLVELNKGGYQAGKTFVTPGSEEQLLRDYIYNNGDGSSLGIYRGLADRKKTFHELHKDPISSNYAQQQITNDLSDYGIKGISYNGGIDGEANVIFNPDDIEIVRKYYNQPNLYDYLMKNSPNIGAATNAIEDILRNPIYPMGDGFKNYEKLGLDYYKNNLQPNPVEIEGYGTVHFGKHNRGKDDITNFRVYPDLREQLMGATRGERTNYNDEADRMYDYFYNTYKGDLYKYLIEDIEGLGKRYKKMRNMRTNK